MSTFLANLSTLAAAWLVSAWMLMLAVGVVHIEWIPQLPTIGFGLALLLSFLWMIRALAAVVLGQVVKAINGGNR